MTPPTLPTLPMSGLALMKWTRDRSNGPREVWHGASERRWSLTQEFLLLALGAKAIATWEEGVRVGLDVPRQASHVHTQPNLQREQCIKDLSGQPHTK